MSQIIQDPYAEYPLVDSDDEGTEEEPETIPVREIVVGDVSNICQWEKCPLPDVLGGDQGRPTCCRTFCGIQTEMAYEGKEPSMIKCDIQSLKRICQ